MTTPTYYELIVELPSDIDTQLPLVSDSFVRWVTSKTWEPPLDSKWDMDQVDQVQLTLGDKIQREILKQWRTITGDPDPKYYVQLEQGETYFHLHTLLQCCNIKPLVLGRYVKQIEKKLVSTVYGGHNPLIDNWLRITKTKSIGGSNKIRAQSYIPAYLIPKKQPEVQWAWTNIEEYIKAVLNSELRHQIGEAHFQEQGLALRDSTNLSRNSEGAPIIVSKCTKKYMELVEWLVEKGITTEKQWLLENKESFRSFQASSNSARQIKAALQGATQEMLLTKTASDYLIGKDPIGDMTDNRIYKILEMNGYDPLYVANLFVGWCQMKFGKRNTIWLFGPATTGKTNIAEAIAHAVPFYGCVNWTNENFPFNDCLEKMIIWWEEGKMTAKIVETAKAILGGSKVRVDQKCKSSMQLEPTPVIITSNTNMCYVVDGNTTTFEHAQPLQDRMFKLELLKRLPDDFGKVTKKEVRDFFAWGAKHTVEVDSCFLVRKAESRKRHAPEVASEDKSPPAKAARTDELQHLSGEEGTSVSARYVLKCAKHLGMVTMMWPCRDCEKANCNINQCILHKSLSCKECFPDYDSDVSVQEGEPSGNPPLSSSDEDIPSHQPPLVKDCKPWTPCSYHHLTGVANRNCSMCKLRNVDLDDCDSEQ
ncbi:rep protein [Dependoparvovirus anseriform4]|uniref:Rep protein n=2 Tax=Adeno-associated virus TaxID=272636 RepID=A0A1C8Z4R5_9VIRU|nr:rep protein [Adeno-associated virus]AOL02446.1 rep protein [Adeno-associated virus]